MEEKERRQDHPRGSHEAESPGSRGERLQWKNKSMILFAAECGFTANLVSNSLSFTWRGCIRVAQTNTHAEATGHFVTWEQVVPIFLSLPSSSCPCLNPSLCLPSLSLSLSVKDKSVFGLRPGMMSMPPSAEQRGVSIQSQGSVCVCASECVFESHQLAQKLIIQQEYTKR